MLARIYFSSRLRFSQFSFLDFKNSHVTGLSKNGGKREGKSAAQTEEGSHYLSSLCFEPGLLSVKQ